MAAKTSPVTVPFSLEVKDSKSTLLATDDGTGMFEALVSVTNIPDHGNDIIEPGAYTDTIKARPHPKLLRGHDWGRRAGKVLQMQEWMPGDWRLPQDLKDQGAGALWIKGQYNLGSTEGRDGYSDLKFDPENAEFSIGYDCSATKSGGARAFRDPKTGLRHIKSLDLFECSDVVVGMAAGTRALCVKALNAGMLPQDRKFSLGELVGIVTASKAGADNQGNNAGTVGATTMGWALGDAVEGPGDDDLDAPANRDRTTDSGEDAFLDTKSRLSLGEWITIDRYFTAKPAALQRKDWAEWDEENPDRDRGNTPGGGQGQQQQSDKPPAPPAPPSAPTQPGQTGGDKPPSAGQSSGAGGGSQGSEGSGGSGGSGGGGEGAGSSPVESLLEQAHNLMEAVHEGVEEGREQGHRWAEQLGEDRQGVNPLGKGLLPVLSVKDLDDDDDDDEEGDSDDPGINLGHPRYMEPEDVNLGGGRHDYSAMKGLRLDPLLPRR